MVRFLSIFWNSGYAWVLDLDLGEWVGVKDRGGVVGNTFDRSVGMNPARVQVFVSLFRKGETGDLERIGKGRVVWIGQVLVLCYSTSHIRNKYSPLPPPPNPYPPPLSRKKKTSERESYISAY